MMAGLDDYQFYTNLKDKDSPFWQKVETTQYPEAEPRIGRPSNFPESFQGSSTSDLNKPFSTDIANQKTSAIGSKDIQIEKYGEVSITLISLCTENLLSHPFIVLRRQCQVNVSSLRYHLQPFTLMPALVHIQSHQGLSALWKGLGSVLTVRGLTLALEDLMSKFTPWPKEISPHSSLKTIGQHLLLKSTAIALITPFYSASLVETVQSEILSERPGVFDVFKEGFCRLLSFTQPQTRRMLPVWLLIVPTVVHGVLQYIIGNAVSTITSQVLRGVQKQYQQKTGAMSKDASLSDASIRLQAGFIGHLAADVILFPIETILHRLHLQGTRVIIDSLDTSYEVLPILTRYEGFFDCLTTTIREEGTLGLFKGFGALCIQYAVYGTILKFAHIIIRDISFFLSPSLPKQKPQEEDPQSKASTFASSYLYSSENHVAPLASGVSYPPISSLHGGISSLHSSPMHSGRQRPQRHPHSGSVDLGDLSSLDYSPPNSRSSHDPDLRADVERHRAALHQFRD